MPNDRLTTTSIASDSVKITSIKYEKQTSSLLIGFNFGCFQVFNMKTLSIDSSSEYGTMRKSVVGFSVLEPQNDPKNCLYLVVAHSSLVEPKQYN